jgi:hypothetical protein
VPPQRFEASEHDFEAPKLRPVAQINLYMPPKRTLLAYIESGTRWNSMGA